MFELQGWGNESKVRPAPRASIRGNNECTLTPHQRSVVEVEWRVSKKKNVYRVGHKGKVSEWSREQSSSLCVI